MKKIIFILLKISELCGLIGVYIGITFLGKYVGFCIALHTGSSRYPTFNFMNTLLGILILLGLVLVFMLGWGTCLLIQIWFSYNNDWSEKILKYFKNERT
jgi:hypothetical protein